MRATVAQMWATPFHPPVSVSVSVESIFPNGSYYYDTIASIWR